MKWLAFILSIYIFSLLSLPCADGADHACSAQTEQSTPNTNHHHNSNGDSCSPFCVCACCNVTVTIVQHFILPSPTEQIYAQMSLYYEGHPTRFSTSIWQPPKVS